MRKSIGCEYFYSDVLRFSAFFSIFLRLIALSYIFGSFKLFAPSNSFILPQIPVEEKHPSHDRCLSKGECSHYSTGYTFSRKAAASGIEPEPRAPPCPPAIGEMLPKKDPGPEGHRSTFIMRGQVGHQAVIHWRPYGEGSRWL